MSTIKRILNKRAPRRRNSVSSEPSRRLSLTEDELAGGPPPLPEARTGLAVEKPDESRERGRHVWNGKERSASVSSAMMIDESGDETGVDRYPGIGARLRLGRNNSGNLSSLPTRDSGSGKSVKGRKEPDSAACSSPGIRLGSSTSNSSAPALTSAPTRAIAADVEVSTRAILSKLSIYFKGHRLQQMADDSGIWHGVGSKRVEIRFTSIRVLRITDVNLFDIVMIDGLNASDLLVRVKDGCMLLVHNLAKWISFSQSRPLDDIIVMAGKSNSNHLPEIFGESQNDDKDYTETLNTEDFVVPEYENESMTFQSTAVENDLFVSVGGSVFDRTRMIEELAELDDESTTLILNHLNLEDLDELDDYQETVETLEMVAPREDAPSRPLMGEK